MTNSSEGILGTIRAIGLSAFYPDKTPSGQLPPYCIVFPSPEAPEYGFLDGRTTFRVATDRVMVVSNNANGAATSASRVVDTLVDTGDRVVESVSDPLADRSDPSRVWWSCTIEVRTHTTRRA